MNVSDKPLNKESQPLPSNEMIPSLPADLLLMIYRLAPKEDRFTMSKTCQLFRQIDFEVGEKQFDTIHVDWTPNIQSITAQGPNVKYIICGDSVNPIQATLHNMRLFRNASTKDLRIMDTTNCDSIGIETMTNIVKSVKCDKFFAIIDCGWNRFQQFVHNLIRVRRNMNGAEVILSCERKEAWHICASNSLMQLPKMEKFLLRNYTVDDNSLLHIISNTHHAEFQLDAMICTAKGLLDAFEVVCESQLSTKFASVQVHLSVLEKMLSLADAKFERFNCTSRRLSYLIDHERKSMLLFSKIRREYGYSKVYMGKMADDRLRLRCKYELCREL